MHYKWEAPRITTALDTDKLFKKSLTAALNNKYATESRHNHNSRYFITISNKILVFTLNNTVINSNLGPISHRYGFLLLRFC